MKPTAIVYTSNTGHTAEYAALLGEKTGLPVYALSESGAPLGSPVIYMGWLMAGKVKGYKKAAKKYKICALCGVGMGYTGSQTEDVKKANTPPDDLPIFTLQGGFDITKLHGIYKFMMNVMAKTAGKSLAEKNDRTPEEDDMLSLLRDGGNRVSADSLSCILDWLKEQ